MNRAQLRALAKAATPGPWQHGFSDGSGVVEDDGEAGGYIITADEQAVVLGASDSWSLRQGVRTQADAAFIAACDPSTILALLDAHEALKKAAAEIPRLYDWHLENLREGLRTDCSGFDLGQAVDRLRALLAEGEG